MKLAIEKVIYGGRGLARIPAEEGPHGGMSVFVPFTLPGEAVEVRIIEERRGYYVAEATHVDRASSFRAAPPCPWFGRCGGCQLQHGAYEYQVELKRQMLQETLTRAGLRELPDIEVMTGEPLGYRNRIRLQVQAKPDFAIGYREAQSHRLVAVTGCPIAAPLLERCIAVLWKLGQQGFVPAGLQEIELFTNHDQSALVATGGTQHAAAFNSDDYRQLFEMLQRGLQEFCGAAIILKSGKHGASGAVARRLQWGEQNIIYRVAGHDYSVGVGSFFQINRTLLDSFVSKVTNGVGGKMAWDLYAGVGLFSVVLAKRFKHVTAVESASSACTDLRHNARGMDVTIVSSATLDFLRQAVRMRAATPDLVVLDPPRTGAGVEACNLLARCDPGRITYVSCDPATLGRDLHALVQSGYRLHRLYLVDLFPQTYHLETVAELSR